MLPIDLPIIDINEFSTCEERREMADDGKSLTQIQKDDATIKTAIYHALWKDHVLRAIEYYEIDVHVKNKTVYLYGHIVGTVSQLRVMNALLAVPGILEIKNYLVLDDKLTLEVAASLAGLEHTYSCKFFTGASHGAVSLNGTVNDQNIKSLAERCAASNPNVRGVINNVRVLGTEPETQDQPFLQPAIGETIYFSDGLSGVVKQVIINPNNRRVIAMAVQGNFREPRNVLHSLFDGNAKPLEQLILVPIKTIRYLTKVSGFLYINSNERNLYQDFDPTSFYAPNRDWTPPYPYCPDEVLFPVEHRITDIDNTGWTHQFPFAETLDSPSFKEQLFENDSLGG